MLTITLYSKEGCPLCEEAKGLLRQLSGRYPHRLEEIYISSDRALLSQYRTTIPVVRIGDDEMAAPIDKEALADFLKAHMGQQA
jgi:glutaredoxin